MDITNFEELEIDSRILRAVKELGYKEPTPIQAKAIPEMLSGQDIIGQAQTGTGKTAAFGIPILHRVNMEIKKTQVIILCPTRELAMQISADMHDLAKYMHGVRIVPIYGGQEIGKQIHSLRGGVQIIVGTPGRVMDHLRRKTIRCDYVDTVVLDEADEMLNMGFREDIETVLQYLPQEHQTVLFSATMPRAILEITKQYQRDAVTIRVAGKELTVENIKQYYYNLGGRDKTDVLTRLLDVYAPARALVFCNTKQMAADLAQSLQERGYSAEGLHGDLRQQERDMVMKNFRLGKTEILVATDVAARGIDVENVEAVFNYDLPQDNEYYVHRIGRTGRAGKSGLAFSFVQGREKGKLKEIMRFCKTEIQQQSIPTRQDVEDAKLEKLLGRMEQILKEQNLSKMHSVLTWQTENTGRSMEDLAAALLYLELERSERENHQRPKEAPERGGSSEHRRPKETPEKDRRSYGKRENRHGNRERRKS